MLVPLGVAVGTLYVTSIFVAMNARAQLIILLGLVTAFLTFPVFIIQMDDETSWMVAANRTISVAAIALTTLLAVRQRKLTDQLDRQISQLGAKTQELQRYTTIAAHDLQEPARNIQSLIDLLRK